MARTRLLILMMGHLAVLAACSEDEASRANRSRYVRNEGSQNVIVFVHGLGGNADETWTNEERHVFWPSLLGQDETFASTDIYVVDYPIPAFTTGYNIDQAGAALRRRLDNHEVIERHAKVVFVCHSAGGLIVRNYLLKNPEAAKKVVLLAMFSTPTNGAQLANVARIVSKSRAVSDMTSAEYNTFLESQQSSWMSNDVTRAIPSVCAFEIRETMGVMVVPRGSATALCTTSFEPIDRDHFGIVKPSDVDDDSHLVLKLAYRKQFPMRIAPVLTASQLMEKYIAQKVAYARNAAELLLLENGVSAKINVMFVVQDLVLVWLGTDRGAFLYQGSTLRPVTDSSLNITSIAADATVAWFCTNQGWYSYDVAAGKTTQKSVAEVPSYLRNDCVVKGQAQTTRAGERSN